jgi:membrane associated rhomboid family serine protease
MPTLPPVTKILMLACVAVFCVQLLPLGLPLNLLALWPIGSGRFWPWQPVTYAFLHGDMLHLFFNMLGLWMFGSELERLWGGRRYWQFLLASVLAAAAV